VAKEKAKEAGKSENVSYVKGSLSYYGSKA
jgi:hypothetical protein